MNNAPQLTDSLDRPRGAMLGSAIGDALGWPMENRSNRVGGISRVKPRLELTGWTRREGGRYAPHEVEVEAGCYSDDTQLTLAIARSRLRGASWWEHWTDCELPLWLVYERGGGGASKRAAQAWNRGTSPWSAEAKPTDRKRYFDAGGNGVAMRIAPHVLIGADSDFAEIAADILADGVCTHGHPRALVGALAYGYALWLAFGRDKALGFGELVERTLQDEEKWGRLPDIRPQLSDWESQVRTAEPSFSEAWERTREETRDLLQRCRMSLGQGSLSLNRQTLEEIGAFDKQTNGAGTVAAAAAIFLTSRYASQPGQGLTAAAFAKGADTDTIAAMTGTLLGAIHGDSWLSSLRAQLQDTEYIEGLTATLSHGSFKPRPKAASWRQRDRRALLDALSKAESGSMIELPVFGRCTIARLRQLPTKSTSTVLEWKLQAEAGPTLYVKRVIQAKNGGAAEGAETTSRPGFWLVLGVKDLQASEHFYSEMMGFPVERRGGRSPVYVLDRIVLEAIPAPSDEADQAVLEDEKSLLKSTQAITLFFGEPEFSRIHKRLGSAEIPVSRIADRNGRSMFRCADPDGNVIEIRASSGTAANQPQRAPG